MNFCSSIICVSLLRKEGRSSGLEVQPQVIKLMRVSLLGMSAGRLLRLVSGRVPRSTLNMICMGLVTSEQTHTHTWIRDLSGSNMKAQRATEQNKRVTNQTRM